MTIKHTHRLLALLSLMLAWQGVAAQDLIAEQAPIDRRLKAVDSVTIQRLIDREDNDLSEELYEDAWNTTMAHPYRGVEMPDSFKIDLRDFCMPTPSRNITSHFGYRPAFRRQHRGIDIKVYTGDTIRAAFDGKVRVSTFQGSGYGHFVVIRHPNGLETLYGHLSKRLVEPNAEVKAGDVIGLGGNTGRSYGSHLHFETRLLSEAIDPRLLFDFPNQDVTGDFYVYRRGASRASQAQAVAVESGSKRTGRDVARNARHYYKVKKGDTIYSIAKKLGINQKQLIGNNSLGRKPKIRPGQILRY